MHRLPSGSPHAPSDDVDDEPGAAPESILLTDPDGAVTRVAPWSTWTREQRRAPGGEPSLLTRLDEGQLWFSAGSSGSPWRHEVRIGPAVVSTPCGRFHAIAEDDGGATIVCLAGRTRVTTSLREPVLLEADQTVAVSSDGATLVVIDHAPEPAPVLAGPALARPVDRPRSRLPEVAAVVALVAVLIGAAVVFGRQLFPSEPVAAPLAFSSGTLADNGIGGSMNGDPTVPTGEIADPDAAPPITEADVVAADDPSPTVAAPAVPKPTTPKPTAPAPTMPAPAIPAPASPAEVAPVTAPQSTATGRLTACRRSPTGVVAVVDVSHRTGGPGRFTVDVAVVDQTGTVVANGSARSAVIEPATSSTVEVAVDAAPGLRGACELTGISGS